MDPEFENLIDRQHIGNMKGQMTIEAADTIMLSGAEMDFPTAPIIRERVADFAQHGLYGFTLPDEPYRQAIVDWENSQRNIQCTPEAIVPTLGTIFSLSTTVRAFTDPGDSVVIQSPSYYRFDRAIRRNGRNVVYNPLIEHQGQYALDVSDLEPKLADPTTKLMVLCNPHNPTGHVFSIKEMQQIAALAKKYHVIIFSDEIFGEFQFGQNVSYAQITWNNAIISTSLGKAFNFTGVSQANMLIMDSDIRKAYQHQQDIDHFGSIDPFFYTAVLAAYTPEGAKWLASVKQYVWNNYQLVQTFLAENLPELTVSELQGGFIGWLDCRKLGFTDDQLADFLHDVVHVTGDPGVEYGKQGSGYFRFNLATPKTVIQQFLNQLKAGVATLQLQK